jgi:hypothetical protein
MLSSGCVDWAFPVTRSYRRTSRATRTRSWQRTSYLSSRMMIRIEHLNGKISLAVKCAEEVAIGRPAVCLHASMRKQASEWSDCCPTKRRRYQMLPWANCSC